MEIAKIDERKGKRTRKLKNDASSEQENIIDSTTTNTIISTEAPVAAPISDTKAKPGRAKKLTSTNRLKNALNETEEPKHRRRRVANKVTYNEEADEEADEDQYDEKSEAKKRPKEVQKRGRKRAGSQTEEVKKITKRVGSRAEKVSAAVDDEDNENNREIVAVAAKPPPKRRKKKFVDEIIENELKDTEKITDGKDESEKINNIIKKTPTVKKGRGKKAIQKVHDIEESIEKKSEEGGKEQKEVPSKKQRNGKGNSVKTKTLILSKKESVSDVNKGMTKNNKIQQHDALEKQKTKKDKKDVLKVDREKSQSPDYIDEAVERAIAEDFEALSMEKEKKKISKANKNVLEEKSYKSSARKGLKNRNKEDDNGDKEAEPAHENSDKDVNKKRAVKKGKDVKIEELAKDAVLNIDTNSGKCGTKRKALAKPTTTSKKPLLNDATNKFSLMDFSVNKEFNFKITSWNVAGLRACAAKGGLEYVQFEKPDILCLQETKCSPDNIPDEAKLAGYHPYWHPKTGGLNGVAIYSKIMPHNVEYNIGDAEMDEDARIITAEYEKFYLICVYVPNSSRKLVNLDKRLRWNKLFENYITKLDTKKPVIICGDMNVSFLEIDLANPKTNKRNAGFTQEERDGMSDMLALGFVDTFRHLYPDREKAYTFWTYMANARKKNVGWRLDYFIVSQKLIHKVVDNIIRSDVLGSDHCPITLLLNNI